MFNWTWFAWTCLISFLPTPNNVNQQLNQQSHPTMNYFTFCKFFVILFTSISLYAAPSFENVSSPFLIEKGSNYFVKKEIRSALLSSNWQKFISLGRSALAKGDISLAFIESLGTEHASKQAMHTFRGTEGLLRLHKKANISLPDCFTLAAFIECVVPESKGSYFPQEKYNLPRTIEIDRKNDKIYIHLGTNGVKQVGKGKFKVITKTVLYHSFSSLIFAQTSSRANIDSEIATMKALQNTPGLLMLESTFKHVDKHGRVTTSFITPVYFPGSLKKLIDSDHYLRFKDKVKIAVGILDGLAGMQKLGYTHRDLSTHNCLVDIRFISGRKAISSVISDFGRSMPITNGHGKEISRLSPQANSSYLAPEGYFKDKMSGADYFKSDIYAVGCILWELYFGKVTPWGEKRFFSQHKLSHKNRQLLHISCQKKAIASLKVKLKKLQHTPEGTYLSIMLKMLRIHPDARGTAIEHADRMEQLSRLVP